MPRFTIRIRGDGRVSVAAFGIADAEDLVRKEISRAWPDATVSITGISRPGEPRIVEEFAVEYVVHAGMEVEATSLNEAAGAAFRRARQIVSPTRYRMTEWSRVSPPAS